jgi:hypothetical protein
MTAAARSAASGEPSPYDDWMTPPRAKVAFSTVPHWLIGSVSPASLELYAYLAIRFGPDGWCWDTRHGFTSAIRSMTWRTYRDRLAELEQAGAIVIFARWTHEGRNGGHAFYRVPTLRPMLDGPLELMQPSRLPGTLTPVRHGVAIARRDRPGVRTWESRKPTANHRAPPRDLARGPGGRFAAITAPESITDGFHQDALPREQPTVPKRTSEPCQDASPRAAELEPIEQEPSDEQEPVCAGHALDEAVIEALARRATNRASSEGAA